MNNILNFENEELGKIRVINKDDEIWFVGKDVAIILGYKRTADAIKSSVDKEDKGVCNLPTPGGKQPMIIINESGLYSLILSSKLPSAKKFKKWVTSEVLPSIRKNGGYIHTTENDTDEVIMSRALLIAKKTIEERDKTIKRKNIEIETLSKENKDLAKKLDDSEFMHDMNKHKVELAETFTSKHDNNNKVFMPLEDLVLALYHKGYDIGKNRLLSWLKHKKLIYKCGYFRPTQKAIKLELFHINRDCYYHGGDEDDKVIAVTAKGFCYIIQKIVHDIDMRNIKGKKTRDYYERQARKLYDSIA